MYYNVLSKTFQIKYYLLVLLTTFLDIKLLLSISCLLYINKNTYTKTQL